LRCSSWETVSDYLQSYLADGVKLLSPSPDTPHAHDPRTTVRRIWELTLDALAAHQLPQARPLLRLLSCYAAAVPIPASLTDPHRLACLPLSVNGDQRGQMADWRTLQNWPGNLWQDDFGWLIASPTSPPQ